MDKESPATRAELRKIVDNQKGSDRLILTKRQIRSLFPRLEQMPERMVTDFGEFDVLDSGEQPA